MNQYIESRHKKAVLGTILDQKGLGGVGSEQWVLSAVGSDNPFDVDNDSSASFNSSQGMKFASVARHRSSSPSGKGLRM